MIVIAHQIRYCSIIHDLFALNFSDKKEARWQAVTGEGGGGGTIHFMERRKLSLWEGEGSRGVWAGLAKYYYFTYRVVSASCSCSM